MDWPSLHTEQVHATRTVQQIKANIYEIEKTRLQVLEEDLDQFDQKIERMKHSALRSVKEFVQIMSHKETTDGNDMNYINLLKNILTVWKLVFKCFVKRN